MLACLHAIAVLGGLWVIHFIALISHRRRRFTSSMFIGLGLGAPLLGLLADRYVSRVKTMSGQSTALLVEFNYLYRLLDACFNGFIISFGLGTGAFMSCYALQRLNQACLAATVISLINSGDAVGSFTGHHWQDTRLLLARENAAGIHVFPFLLFIMLFIITIYLSALLCLWFLSKNKTL